MNPLKNTILFGICLFILLFHFSCRKGEEPVFNKTGVRTQINPIWTRSLHPEYSYYSNSSIQENLVYKGNPIIATTEGHDNRWINLIDIETGEDIWKWNDIYRGFGEYIDIRDAYINDNLMWYQQGSRSYTLNLDDGSTHRKERFFGSFSSELSGLEHVIFLMGPSVDTLEEYETKVGYIADLQEGSKKQFLFPKISLDYIAPGNNIGGLGDITPFIVNSDTFLVTVHSEPLPNWYIDPYLGLYNLSKKEWVYEKISLVTPSQGSGVYNRPIIYDDKIYMNIGAGNLICHDLFTGELIWDYALPARFDFSGILVQEGKVVVNCDDYHTYGFDAQTGVKLWRGEGSANGSRFRYANGIVYFSGVSSGKLHAVDIHNGKSVWKIDASSLKREASFKPDIYLIEGRNGEKPKIVFCTYRNAYCVEAYR